VNLFSEPSILAKLRAITGIPGVGLAAAQRFVGSKGALKIMRLAHYSSTPLNYVSGYELGRQMSG
jgi:hypothetical protein